jgi:short subunit dehydrogenase-like uncharacterized protein
MTDLSRCLIYGAYGYTGELTARLAKERGYAPTLAGRSESKLAPLADELGLPSKVVSLDDAAGLDAALADFDIVLHCAGPFSRTSKPMVDACLRTQTHYTDITGEISVYEACAARDAEAKEANVLLMPGVGADVVPTDCLAAHLKARLPSATSLTLAFYTKGPSRASGGTARTAVEAVGYPSLVRRGGRIVPIRSGKLRRSFEFNGISRTCAAIQWGDVSTAFHSSGFTDVTVYLALPPKVIRAMRVAGFLGPLFRTSFMKERARARIDARPKGPSAEKRAASEVWYFGEATDGERSVASQVRCPDGYELTADASLEICRRLLETPPSGGFTTPAKHFGADFVLELDGTRREDLV